MVSAAGEGAAQFVLCRCSESNGAEQLRSAKNNVLNPYGWLAGIGAPDLTASAWLFESMP